jgi:hypothetical protein
MQRTARIRVGAILAALVIGFGVLAGPASAQSSFTDIAGNEYYADAVEWMEAQGITDGVGNTGEYQPHEIVNRAQIATFLWRMAGSPGGNPDHGFNDVPEGRYYSEAVKWLRAQGYTTGVGGTDVSQSDEFQPLEPVLRNQAFTLMWRYGGEPRGYPPHGFDDIPPRTYYERAVRWARAEGITTGLGGSNDFGPTQELTRGQLAAVVWRYAGFPAPDEPGNTEPDAWRPGNANNQ